MGDSRNLAQCHIACANLDDGLEEMYLLAVTVTRFVQTTASKTANQTILYRYVPQYATGNCDFTTRRHPADIAQVVSRKVAKKRHCTLPVGWCFGLMGPYRHMNVFVGMSLRCAIVPHIL